LGFFNVAETEKNRYPQKYINRFSLKLSSGSSKERLLKIHFIYSREGTLEKNDEEQEKEEQERFPTQDAIVNHLFKMH